MKAARVHGPRRIVVEEVDTPSVKTGEVLIKVEMAGVCGADIAMFSGDFDYIRNGSLKYPFIPGHEWSGAIVELGDNIRHLSVGDKVVGDVSLGCGNCAKCLNGRYDICFYRQEVGSYRNKDGAFAEYLIMPARYIHIVPEGVSYEQAALTEPASVCVYAVTKAAKIPGGIVLIQGDGTIGLLCLQAAKAFGAYKTIISGFSPYKLSKAKDLGASEVVHVNHDNLLDAVNDLTNGYGVDVAIEASGAIGAIETSLAYVRAGGELVIPGIYEQKVQFDMTSAVLKDITMYGSHVSPGMIDLTLRMIDNKMIDVSSLITHYFKLNDITDAFAAYDSERESRIKILISTKC